MAKCKNCHIEFEARRSTRQFCTTMCKNNFHNFLKNSSKKSVVYLLQDGEKVRVSPTDAPTCQVVLTVESVENVTSKFGNEWFIGNIVDLVRDIKAPPPQIVPPPQIAPVITPPPVTLG